MKRILMVTVYLFLFFVGLKSQNIVHLKGKIIDSDKLFPIEYAVITLDNKTISVESDHLGQFRFPPLNKGKYDITIRRMGYHSRTIKNFVLDKNVDLEIKLSQQTYALKEVLIKPTYKNGSNARIGQAAIEYLQPNSLADVFVLIPGGVFNDIKIQKHKLITSRQAGEDKNTSLGMSIVMDGVSMTNDGNRFQLAGITGESQIYDDEILLRRATNAGIDMRNISTDHIQSVEIIRGISSAKIGNLSSGSIIITSKKGSSPLSTRIKTDPLNKLIYAGKGFKISDKLGSVHVGLDLLNSKTDVREELDKYTRITTQINYSNSFSFSGKSLSINSRMGYVFSANDTKNDEILQKNNEEYNSKYNSLNYMLKSNLTFDNKYIEQMEFISSISYDLDYLSRKKMVHAGSIPLTIPYIYLEGEQEGKYLPSMYYSNFAIDDKKANFFMQINATSRLLGDNITNVIQYGGDWKVTKNFGEGTIIDYDRPPYPLSNSFIKSRPNHQVPSISILSGYIENILNYETSSLSYRLSTGVRLSEMLNLPKRFYLSDKINFEPRLQASVTRESSDDYAKSVKNTFRIGYGEENKLPTLDYLYPERVYKNYDVLNSFSTNPDYRKILTYSTVHSMVNKDLKANRNRKFEFGWDFSYSNFESSISMFYEKSNDGFTYRKVFVPIEYKKYVKRRRQDEIMGQKPEKDDYVEEIHNDYGNFVSPHNSVQVVKKGIEYRFLFSKIKSINSDIEINGAYYKTRYSNSIPVMFHPTVASLNKVFPLVGIYESDGVKEMARFNSNMWINTHLPKFRMIFTSFFQVIWFETAQNTTDYSFYPEQIMNFDGDIREVTQEELHKIKTQTDFWGGLNIKYGEVYYRKSAKPISVRINFKTTKEITDSIKLSFFINNIIDINPKYKNIYDMRVKNWVSPFFGGEITIKI